MHNLSDRALKERIIGAVVLVVFAVLVVPIFLDGPAEEPEIVSESVTLPGQNNQERKQQTIVLERDRSEPVPASRTPPQTQSAVMPQEKAATAIAEDKTAEDKTPEKPMEATAKAPPKPAPEPPPKAVETSTTGMWAVQLGSFSSEENAERLAATLRDQGYAAFLSQLPTDSGQLHRVRIGPQKDRDSAEDVAAQLSKSGHNGQVVPHP